MSLSSLKGSIISFDTETTGLNPWGSFDRYGYYPARPFFFAFEDSYGNQARVRWEVDPFTRQVIVDEKSRKAMSEILGDPSIVKVGHNLAFDIRMARLSGIKFDWSRVHDTLFLSHIYTGGSLSFTNYALKPLCEHWGIATRDDEEALLKSVRSARVKAKKLGWKIATEETHGKNYIKSDYWLGDRKLCRSYALGDTHRAMVIFMVIHEAIKKDPDASKLLEVYERELKVMKVVHRVEKNGVRVFPEDLDRLEKFYSEYSKKWKKVIDQEGGKNLNLNSPKQLVKEFCDIRGYKTVKRTKGGQPSINADELARLSVKDKLAKAILEYKAGESMLTKFIKPYRRFMVKETENCWVLHPNLRQVGTTTGRMSCSDPNLQQAAAEDSAKKRADIGLKPREAMGPRDGCVWYLPDFSQMEVWVFAFQSREKVLMKALLAGEDVHGVVGKQVWGNQPDYEQNKKLYRKKGKTMMFLKQYGGTKKAAAELLQCNTYQAQLAIDEFDDKFPGVNTFIENMTKKIEMEGHFFNCFGRKYVIDSRFAYKGINYNIQGPCADLVKEAMIRIDFLYRTKWKGSKMLLTLHDELILEVPKKLDCPEHLKDIVKAMQKDSARIGLPVKIPVTMKKTLTRWSAAEEVK